MKRARDHKPESIETLEAMAKEKEDAITVLKRDLGVLRRRLTKARKLVPLEADLKDVLSQTHAALYLKKSVTERAILRASALALEDASPGLVRRAIGLRMTEGAVTWCFRKWADYYTYITPGAPASIYGIKDKERMGWHDGGDWAYEEPTTVKLVEKHAGEIADLMKTRPFGIY